MRWSDSVLTRWCSRPRIEWTDCHVRGYAGAVAGEGTLKPGIGCELPKTLITGIKQQPRRLPFEGGCWSARASRSEMLSLLLECEK